MGTARPRPTPAIAVLIPMTRPWLSASAPPQSPVECRVSRDDVLDQARGVRLRAGMLRPRALMTRRPRRPRAQAGCRRPPRASHEKPVRVAILRRCRQLSVGADDGQASDSGSRPTTSKWATVPSANSAMPPLVSPTTWALVTRCVAPSQHHCRPCGLRAAHRIPQRRHLRRELRGNGGGDRGVGVQCVRLCVRIGGHAWTNDWASGRDSGLQ